MGSPILDSVAYDGDRKKQTFISRITARKSASSAKPSISADEVSDSRRLLVPGLISRKLSRKKPEDGALLKNNGESSVTGLTSSGELKKDSWLIAELNGTENITHPPQSSPSSLASSFTKAPAMSGNPGSPDAVNFPRISVINDNNESNVFNSSVDPSLSKKSFKYLSKRVLGLAISTGSSGGIDETRPSSQREADHERGASSERLELYPGSNLSPNISTYSFSRFRQRDHSSTRSPGSEAGKTSFDEAIESNRISFTSRLRSSSLTDQISLVSSIRAGRVSGSRTPSSSRKSFQSSSQVSLPLSKKGSPILGETPFIENIIMNSPKTRGRSHTLNSLMESTVSANKKSISRSRSRSKSFIGSSTVLLSGDDSLASSSTINVDEKKASKSDFPENSPLLFNSNFSSGSNYLNLGLYSSGKFLKSYSNHFSPQAYSKPSESDTYLSYILKLLDSGFSYEIVDILTSKISIQKYGEDKTSRLNIIDVKNFCKHLITRNYTIDTQSEFYTNCLYLYTYVCFISMFYESSPLFINTIDASLEHPVRELIYNASQNEIDFTKDRPDLHSFISNLENEDFIKFISKKVSSIPIDLIFRYFMFYNKLPSETEKIDLILEVISYNYQYFLNLENIKSIYKEHRDKLASTEDVDATVIVNNDYADDDSEDDYTVLAYAGVNNSIFNSISEIYTLLFVLLALQTDHFNKNNKTKMTFQDFTKIILNFKADDLDKIKKSKKGSKLSETDDFYLMFNLMTQEIIYYFFENITYMPLKSVTEVIQPLTTVESRSGSIVSSSSLLSSSLISPTSPTFSSSAGSTKKRSNSFFVSAVSSPANNPYCISSFDDFNQLVIDFNSLGGSSADPFKRHFDQFVNTSNFYNSKLFRSAFFSANSEKPDCVLRLDHSQVISDNLYKVSHATIKPSLDLKDKEIPVSIRKDLLHNWPQCQFENTDKSVFVRIYKIGVMYKQESRISLLPKRNKKKNKRRSKNFKNTNLNDSDSFSWKKYYAILTNFGLYIFKNISWDVLEGFEEDIEAKGNKNYRKDHEKKLIKLYSSSFFLHSSGSELELAIPIEKIFAYHNKYKGYNSFYICSSNVENDSHISKVDEAELINDWMSNSKNNKVYNKGLFYCDSEKDADEWVYNINFLGTLYLSLPQLDDESFTNLSLPSYDNVYELTISKHMSLSARHRELQKDLKMINKLKLNYQRILSFVKGLTPYSNKNKLQLKKLVYRIYSDNLRSLWFEELKTKTFIFIAEEAMKHLGANVDLIMQQRRISTISNRVEDNVKYLNFCDIANSFALLFTDPLLATNNSYESTLQNRNAFIDLESSDGLNSQDEKSDVFPTLVKESNLEYDMEMTCSPMFKTSQIRQLL